MSEATANETGEPIVKQQPSTGVSVSSSLASIMGDAASAVFLLRDYSKFGLAERVCYHFDLAESLMVSESLSSLPVESDGDSFQADSNDEIGESSQPVRGCGVLRLLEFAPTALWQRLTRRQKKFMRSKLRSFNQNAGQVHAEGNILCYQPMELPLRCNPSTRVYFGYEVTRIAFCVDASASLTSTFGVMGQVGNGRSKNPLCPLDRLPQMARMFFQGLIQPVTTATMIEPWKPRLSVTILAVYPMGETSETSLLVRDYQVHDSKSAKRLVDEIEKWTYSEVESGISERIARRHASNAWSTPIYSSNLKHILEAGDYALDILSSEARPVIVVATDGRAVSCEGIVDVSLDVDRVDIPVHILDLSMSESHIVEEMMGEEVDPIEQTKPDMNFLSYDPGGTMDFPAHLTDDSEFLFVVSRATGGCFFDTYLLVEAARNTAGQQFLADDLAQQSYSFKRRFAKMNGLQWLVLFSLSPLSPTFNSSWGKLVPPIYLQKQLNKSGIESALLSNVPSDMLDGSRHQTPGSDHFLRKHHHTSRSTFSIYVVSPVRVKTLILKRIKEGYRAKQYGLSTNDPDKVFIQFTLHMEFGTILHYELSYKSLSSDDNTVGSAHVKIELSGDTTFVQLVKNDFLKHTTNVTDNRFVTLRTRKSSRLCHVIRSTRRDDILQSFLKPPQKWSDQLVSPTSPFSKRLGALTINQRKIHFQADNFDVVCTGLVPYGTDDQFLSQFVDNEDGVQELIEAISTWSSLVVKKGSTFVKRMTTVGRSTNYCIIELTQTRGASNLYTVKVEFFGGTDPEERLRVVSALKNLIGDLKNVKVLHKQMAPFLAGHTHRQAVKKQNVEIQFHHATWDLFMDPELLPLLTKRRVEIGHFRLLESRDEYALFAKLIPTGSSDASSDDLVQYQVAVIDEKVTVDLHMESESGVFNPYQEGGKETGRFERMVNTIRRRDQECSRALRSRTNLLRIFHASPHLEIEESHHTSVTRILAYSSRVTRNLRFFITNGGANEILTRLTSDLLLSSDFDVDSEKLDIGSDEIVREEEPGLWFLQQYDRQTMSIVHLSVVDQNLEDLEVYQNLRAMTFFTNGIGDLYSKRDDLADDDSTESHISEYLCVSEFADKFEMYQRKNFTLALYLALRQAKQSEETNLSKSDFEYALESLEFVEVCSILVGGTTSRSTGSDSKLLQNIRTILQPVPGDSSHFFYSGDAYDGKSMESGDHDSIGSSESSSDSSADFSAGSSPVMPEEQVNSFRPTQEKEEEPLEDNSGVSRPDASIPEPIFVKFQIDGAPVSIEELSRITRSGILKATVSVFKSTMISSTLTRGKSWSHRAFASEITALLRSFVAEQTLARLQGADDLLSQESLQLVMKCLSRIQSVVSFYVEIYFFISQRGMMMPAGAPAGAEAAVEEGFSILDAELTKNTSLSLTRLSGSMYFVSRINVDSDEPLVFWCILSLQNSSGTIACQIYHPEGQQKAMTVLHQLHTILCSCIHLTNQRLLLQSMHRTRMASELLIPSNTKPLKPSAKNEDGPVFRPGVFSCPVVFQTVFDLYQRAATNPTQVARTLEATVLHNFAVSNRSGISVYKDESGAIFYMEIQPKGNGIDTEGQVELLVYGLGDPGPSVTSQLRVLLQRRLLLIAVDMLSNVLTKNPHFKWKKADFAFLRSFEKEWVKLENGETKGSQYRYYKFPKIVYDPCMVLLFLRQNLCGSTFFHRLNDIDQTGHNPSPPITKTEKSNDSTKGVSLNLNQHEFSLYYNYAPSKLEPTFQGLSTLTEKGAEYCRQTGSGIAMIEFTLVKAGGGYIDEISFAQLASCSHGVAELPSNLKMDALSSFPTDDDGDAICARIKITDTALNRDALHAWICLTLNQAMVAWVAERWLERSFFWLLPMSQDSSQRGSSPRNERLKRDCLTDALCPSLPAVFSIFESSYNLPHPAITRFESVGVTTASSVASLTLTLLQKHILSPLVEKKLLNKPNTNTGKRSLLDQLAKHVSIIRRSRSGNPVLVQMDWSERGKVSVVGNSEDGTTRTINDSPVDCPEYWCFLSLSERDENVISIDNQLRLCKEVVVHDGLSEKSASIDLLESIKKTRPQAFFRSFSFILSVKRNCRILWTYNWNPDVAKNISALFREADNAITVESTAVSCNLQRRSLGLLSPGKSEVGSKRPQKNESSTKEETPKSGLPPLQVSESIDRTRGYGAVPLRRIQRPTTIRRPKLIGKSVEGAAMQAVAASRKRASSNQFRNIPSQAMKQAGRVVSSKESTKAGRGRPSAPSRSSPEQQNVQPSRVFKDDEDEKADRVKQDYLKLCKPKQIALCRLSSLQRNARLKLMNTWWPRSSSHSVPLSILDTLRIISPKGWHDVCSLPPLPGQVKNIFIQTFARWILALTPGLELVRTNDPTRTQVETSSRSVFLCSTIRNVRGTKCCAIVKVSLTGPPSERRGTSTVRAQGWMLNLPRRTKEAQRRKPGGNLISALSLGRDSAGMDVLMTEVHLSFGLERLLFDFSASMVERAVRMLDCRISFEDLLPTVRELLRRYPYECQKRIPKLNYRIFEGTIILRSYGDPFIDMFGSKSLFRRLQCESSSRDLLDCKNALCFKKPISIKGSQSICFLVPHETDDTKMNLVVLCRTQGVNIADFMFREGSNVAIHILDNIAVEGAGLSLKELHYAAKCLLRDSLWNEIISMAQMPKKGFSLQSSPRVQPSIKGKFYEMLSLVHVQSLLDLPSANVSAKAASIIPVDVYFLFSDESGIDWLAICSGMKKSPAFSSCLNFTGEKGTSIELFYLSSQDVFIKLELGSCGQLLRADLVTKTPDYAKSHAVFEIVVNYTLHYLWHNF
ncbi:hypothetical protein IV203_002942 [Nitzschia inconspicua]|uniref:Uncharacterized protein n=1 Tax=Nitzschia inconspicua TaxID=303405 RepID=A0A9K3L1D1_9STRA|nr:hypothetical protein IV203_002942 [Nitzschia inconspicua]